MAASGTAFFSRWTPWAQGLLRLVTAFLFMQHGVMKLFGASHVDYFSLIGVAGLIEVIGGALVLIGLWVRPAAFVMSGEMAFAYFMAHASQGHVLQPMQNHGEPAVLYCFIFLFFAAAGAGALSVDAMRGAKA